MAIEKLTLVHVEGGLRKINKTLIKCCESGCFHINAQPDRAGAAAGARSLRDKGVYEKMIKRCRTIADTLGVKLSDSAPYDDLDYNVSVDFKEYLDKVEVTIGALSDEKIKVNSQLHSDGAIYHNLLQFEGFDEDFSELFACKYIKVRFGRLPKDSIEKLSFYKDKAFFFYPFEEEENYQWCLYLASVSESASIDYIFGALGFERTKLPDFVKGNTKQASQDIIERMEYENSRIVAIDKTLDVIANREREKLSKVYSKLIAINNSYELRQNVLVFNGRFSFSGYVPSKEAQRFAELINSVGDVEVTVRSAEPDAPVKLKNNRLFRPFEMFVKMYGLPAANGIDPTPIVAVTYMLLYGMMFGDLGQGILIMIIGIFLTIKTKLGLAPIITRIGFSSALFGVLYGSVFGNEEIIEPFFRFPKVYEFLGYTEPPKDVFSVSTMFLLAALAVGIVLILFSMIMNIIVSFKMKDLGSALFGASGVFGFIFYAGLVVGLGLKFAMNIDIMNSFFIIFLIVIPLAAIFFKEPLLRLMGQQKRQEKKPRSENGMANIDTGLREKLEALSDKGKTEEKKSVGNFIIEGVIELFETCLTYVTNTMSYLRIGGFILSHAGLMLVFSIIANMCGEEGSIANIIVLILGNIFVTGFEGFIVGIQVLRLEFYELFSRYFKSGGTEFKPVSISSAKV